MGLFVLRKFAERYSKVLRFKNIIDPKASINNQILMLITVFRRSLQMCTILSKASHVQNQMIFSSPNQAPDAHRS